MTQEILGNNDLRNRARRQMIQDHPQRVGNEQLFNELFSTFPEDWAQVPVDELDHYYFCFFARYLRPTVEELFAFNIAKVACFSYAGHEIDKVFREYCL